MRVREFRDGEEYIGTVGPLKEGSPIIAEVRKLQRAAYDGNRGTWFTRVYRGGGYRLASTRSSVWGIVQP